MTFFRPLLIVLVSCLQGHGKPSEILQQEFQTPPFSAGPQTWFHLLDGNMNQKFITQDLEAIREAGITGIQVFNGKGRPWPGVKQVRPLSKEWEEVIAHIGNETDRLGLKFTKQNCMGWAMSGGPWIKPEDAMRHLVWSRTDLQGGQPANILLKQADNTQEDWRDYQDITVLAFPTPQDDIVEFLIPSKVSSNVEGDWEDLFDPKKEASLTIRPSDQTQWVEIEFKQPTYLRTIELPVTGLLHRVRTKVPRTIQLQAFDNGKWTEVATHELPRGRWQDREDKRYGISSYPVVLAFPDFKAQKFRFVFDTKGDLELDTFNLISAARVHQWRTKAAYVMRTHSPTKATIQNPATWVKQDSIIDLSEEMDADGQLTWNAPSGSWTILRYGHVNTGVKNHPAPPIATGFECNKLSKEGIEKHFENYIGRLCRDGGPADKGRLNGILVDSWECYTQTWTSAMAAEFEGRQGYELKKFLPAISGWVLDDHHTSERFLRDWRSTINDLLVENYYGHLTELSHEHGLTVHFETALGDVAVGDPLQYYRAADIPMCEFWRPNDREIAGLEYKQIFPAASAAHIYGKNILAAEALTSVGLNWDEAFYEFKACIDRHLVAGVNHLIFHTFTHNPFDKSPGTSFGGGIGSPFVRNQTWWQYMPELSAYLSRCHLMLQAGNPCADVLWYLGDEFDHPPRQFHPFPDGYRFDYLNQDVLLNHLQAKDGKLQIENGTSWKLIWMDEDRCQRLTTETLLGLKKLIEEGATVLGSAPALNSSLSGGTANEMQFASLIKQLWGDTDSPTGSRKIGKGTLLWGISPEEALSQCRIIPDVIGASSDFWTHRKMAGKDIYFITAGHRDSMNANLQFRTKGVPSFWNPMTGETTPARVYSHTPTHTVVPISLDVGGSIFVVFESDNPTPHYTEVKHNGQVVTDAKNLSKTFNGKRFPYLRFKKFEPDQPWVDSEPLAPIDANKMIAWDNGSYTFLKSDGRTQEAQVAQAETRMLDQDWTLDFPKGWDTVPQQRMRQVQPWNELEDPATRAFSGTASYRTTISVENISPDDRFLLDLGRVDEIAEVLINGEQVAVLWAPPFRTNITEHLTPGNNQLEVKVTNTWNNRLVYDSNKPTAQRKTWTIGKVKPKAEPESGLSGPVKLIRGKHLSF